MTALPGKSHDPHAADRLQGDEQIPEDFKEEGGGPVKPFLEHLEDLRWVMIRCVVSVTVAMIVCLAASPYIVDILAQPLNQAKSFITENRKSNLLEKENKRDLVIQLTQDDSMRIPIDTNLANEAFTSIGITNTNAVPVFRIQPRVEGGKLELILEPLPDGSTAVEPMAGPELKAYGPLNSFMVALQMAFYGGLGVASPFVLFFAGQFIVPALRRKEKKLLARGVFIGSILFFCGAAFCYFLLMQIALSTSAMFANWLHFGADEWRAEAYISFVCKFMLGMGIAFELPVVILVLVRVGVLDYKKLSKFRIYWVVINLVLASMLTPPDVVTQVLMALPMQLFYEVSVLVAYIWYRQDKKREECEEAERQAEEAREKEREERQGQTPPQRED